MLFSRLPALGRRSLLLLLAAHLYACGTGGQNSGSATPASDIAEQSGNTDISVSAPDTYVLSLDRSEGGYVLNSDISLLCSEQSSQCATNVKANSIETLRAIARFGSTFTGWNSSENRAEALDIEVAENTNVKASFQSISMSDTMPVDRQSWSCTDDTASKFHALHLGDSLTLGSTAGKIFYVPELAAIHYYEESAAAHVTEPTVVAMYGWLTVGPATRAPEQQGLAEDHYWKQEITKKHLTMEDFDGVVVALGSNDAWQVIHGLDPDFVIEQRIKPLLEWLGDRPVYWILPHYGRWPTAMQNIQFSGTSEGLDCACNSSAAHSSTQCNIIDEMQNCAVDQGLQQQTIQAFRSIHALREGIAALQDEYPNLIVVDPIQTVAAASNNQYDLYATMSPRTDTIHFSLQGAEWYAWLHAWLALHADTSCSLPALQKWQMGSAEIAMAAQLNSAP